VGLVTSVSKAVANTLSTAVGMVTGLSRAIEVSPTLTTQVGIVSFVKFLGLATIEVLVSWDGTGNFDGAYDDITADVKYLRIRRGRNSELGFAEMGTLEMRVKDANGKYSPENSSGVLYGSLLPKRQVKVRGSLGGEINIFCGYLEEIVCHPNLEQQESYLYVVDGLDFLSRAEISGTLYKNTASGTLVGHILNAANWPATARTISTGTLTVPYGWWESSSALNAIRDLEKSEFKAFAYIDNDGNLVWEDSDYRSGLSTSATFDDDYQDIVYKYGAKSIYNEIRIKMRKWELQPLAEIWRLEETPSIAASGTSTFWATFEDIADSITTPASTTDYTANTAADGSGDDKTAQISINTTKFAQSAKLAVTNNDAGTVYITLLRLRGELYDTKTPIIVKAEDATSQTAYQKRTLIIESKFQTSTTTAQTYATAALAKYKDPHPDITLTLIGTPEGYSDQLIHRQISDKITIANTRLGLSATAYYIEQIEYEFSEGGKKQVAKWTLSEA